jgi:putative nucleotidyltransferase with HDIG domain
LDQLLASLVLKVTNAMQSQSVYLLLPSPITKDYVARASSNPPKSGSIYFSINSPLVMTLQSQDQIIDINDIDIIPAINNMAANDRQILLDNGIELLMPLKKEGQLVGILFLSQKLSGETFTNEDKKLLQAVSEDIAVRIDNASRYNDIIKANSELQKTMEGVISAVSAVVEFRDPYTAGHQRRVAALAQAIAGEMGLSEWQMKGMYIIGLLHDVGKIAVPSEILSKPGKISQYEFNIIKGHSQAGFEVIEKVDFPWPVAKAILQHHERNNGSGYPAGLGADDIILEAKIIGVADVVEAMSSHRPYRPALGVDSAIKEIKTQTGILYDPEVVAACLRLLHNGQFSFDKLMSAASASQPVLVKS